MGTDIDMWVEERVHGHWRPVDRTSTGSYTDVDGHLVEYIRHESIYDQRNYPLFAILADVRKAGLGEMFPATVAEPYMAAVRRLVELEIDVFRHRVLSSGAPSNVAEIAKVSVALGERLIIALRQKLLPGLLEKIGQGGK